MPPCLFVARAWLRRRRVSADEVDALARLRREGDRPSSAGCLDRPAGSCGASRPGSAPRSIRRNSRVFCFRPKSSSSRRVESMSWAAPHDGDGRRHRTIEAVLNTNAPPANRQLPPTRRSCRPRSSAHRARAHISRYRPLDGWPSPDRPASWPKQVPAPKVSLEFDDRQAPPHALLLAAFLSTQGQELPQVTKRPLLRHRAGQDRWTPGRLPRSGSWHGSIRRARTRRSWTTSGSARGHAREGRPELFETVRELMEAIQADLAVEWRR